METKIYNILLSCITDRLYYKNNGIKLPDRLNNIDFIEISHIDIISEKICDNIILNTNLKSGYDDIFEEICTILCFESIGYKCRSNNDEYWVIIKNDFNEVSKKIADFLRKTAKNY